MKILEFPQNEKYELSLIMRNDSYLSLKKYLEFFLEKSFELKEIPQKRTVEIKGILWGKLPIIVERYLESESRKKKVKFSVYFSWYLAQEINKG